MSDFMAPLVALINRVDVLVLDIVFIVFSILIAAWVWNTIKTLRNQSLTVEIANKLIKKQQELAEKEKECDNISHRYRQVSEIIRGIKDTDKEINYLFWEMLDCKDEEACAKTLERTLAVSRGLCDRMAIDLKFFAGEIHRCALWERISDEELGMTVSSSAFTDSYREDRTLSINGSRAGICFRTKKLYNIDDITVDNDFDHQCKSGHIYNSLVCSPIVLGNDCFGVLTVDGKNVKAFNDNDVLVIEAYAERMAILLYIRFMLNEWKEG